MNEKQAIAKLRKVIGPKIGWQYSRHALNAAGREAEREKANALRKQERELKEQLDEMRARLLADPEYVALRKQWSDTKDGADRASSLSYSKPIRVGKSGELFGDPTSIREVPLKHISAFSPDRHEWYYRPKRYYGDNPTAFVFTDGEPEHS